MWCDGRRDHYRWFRPSRRLNFIVTIHRCAAWHDWYRMPDSCGRSTHQRILVMATRSGMTLLLAFERISTSACSIRRWAAIAVVPHCSGSTLTTSTS